MNAAADQNPDPNSNAQTAAEESQAQATPAAEQLAQRVQQAENEREEFRDRWMRSQAEFENFRKRLQKDLDQERQYRVLGIVRDLLPVLDNLNRAIQASKSGGDVNQLVQGVQMVAQQFEDVLGRHSVVPIEAAGKPFDPNLHEAVSQVSTSEHPHLTVLNEVERGYQLHDRVVRPTKVVVSSAPPQG
jgi:molecular chaperone GrpE